MTKSKLESRATLLSSTASQLSKTETEMSSIDFSNIKCSPLKVLQFLILDLQNKVKISMPEGEKRHL